MPHEAPTAPMSPDALKALVGQAALAYVEPGQIIGVGTGSTVNCFIDALATVRDRIPGAVSSSVATTQRLRAIGVPVFDANEVETLSVRLQNRAHHHRRGRNMHMVGQLQVPQHDRPAP